MFVGEEGRILGSITIGGCVDARVIEEAEAIMAGGVPRLLDLQLGDEEAWEIGLTCGGLVEVFLERLDFSDPSDPVVRMFEVSRKETKAGQRVVIATLVAAPDDSQVQLGTRMLIDDDGNATGTLLESLNDQIIHDARDLMTRWTSRTLSYSVQGEGLFDVFIEVLGPALPLLIFGASYVAIPLVSFANALGYKTVVVDARPKFANRVRFPEADQVIEGIPSEVAERLTMDRTTSVLLLAHDYKYEVPVLKRVLATDVSYIGLLGSRRRGSAILDLLREQGIEEEQLRRVRVPVGLDLGAQTAPEIALSIMAEILAVTCGRAGRPLSAANGTVAAGQEH
jgi:xanthine dehydrogenase accessory factor